MKRVVVVGAGVGGLTAAAVLARSGIDVVVLEAHVYPGGCAGTFFHQGYRFDAGATLAGGFYTGGPMDVLARAAGVKHWPATSAQRAMVVHMPGGATVTRWTDERWCQERKAIFGPQSETFWRWQEQTADALWDLTLRAPPWPPQTSREWVRLARTALSWLGSDLCQRPSLGLTLDAVRPVAARLSDASEQLRLFVDAQLLISAQTTSVEANALYGASALDLPRRGVVHLAGGMGTIAQTLTDAVRQNGAQVHFRQEVHRVVVERGRPVAVETKRGDTFSADAVIVNLPPGNVARLLCDSVPRRLRDLPARPTSEWGAYMVYVGADSSVVPKGFCAHHQVVVREPLAEGNTVFLSVNPAWDEARAPQGKRALTISTHTKLAQWWDLFENDRPAYEVLKRAYTERVLDAADVALPGLRDAAALVLPGTPVTFERFTRRKWGWVGGFPQTHLLRAWAPKLGRGLWMVGDSIFPGQSTAAVALGGMRVARSMLAENDRAFDESSAVNRISKAVEGY